MSVIVYYLETCDTCKRIIKPFLDQSGIQWREIKSEPISATELDQMKELAGSYQALFSKRARKFRAEKLHEQELSEADYRRLILEEYTFLKRPVALVNDQIFIGNAAKNVSALHQALEALR